jgi:hypothetical protein
MVTSILISYWFYIRKMNAIRVVVVVVAAAAAVVT